MSKPIDLFCLLKEYQEACLFHLSQPLCSHEFHNEFKKLEKLIKQSIFETFGETIKLDENEDWWTSDDIYSHSPKFFKILLYKPVKCKIKITEDKFILEYKDKEIDITVDSKIDKIVF